jgi:hypothetical protein
LSAQEWNQWRGPARDGSVAARNAPRTWQEQLRQTWRVEVGEGYSSSVVSAGRIFVISRRDLVTALNLADGKVLWTQNIQPPLRRINMRCGRTFWDTSCVLNHFPFTSGGLRCAPTTGYFLTALQAEKPAERVTA